MNDETESVVSPCCGHVHTPSGCTGDPTPSDLWAGVSPSVCDCDDWDDGTDWEAEAHAASGVDEPPWTGPDVPGPADLGAC